MIVEFEPNRMLLSYPPQWWVRFYDSHGYSEDVHMTHKELKLFLENIWLRN
jgi:hypothetical protein